MCSSDLDQPTDSLSKIMASIRQLLDAIDVQDGIRLLGVGVAGLTDFAQTDLLADLLAEPGDEVGSGSGDERADGFGDEPGSGPDRLVTVEAKVAEGVREVASGQDFLEEAPSEKGFGWTAELVDDRVADSAVPDWRPGLDVVHAERGPGWVQGAGLGRVTVRFEGPHTGPGPIRTFRVDDPDLTLGEPPVW